MRCEFLLCIILLRRVGQNTRELSFPAQCPYGARTVAHALRSNYNYPYPRSKRLWINCVTNV
jgi:hypothetical protein